MGKGFFAHALSFGALALGAPLAAEETGFEAAFDTALGTEVRSPARFDAVYANPLEQQIAALADGSNGRIGVYAIDLSTGREVGILADQLFPMASTSKVAIAATFLAGVDAGKYCLNDEYRLPRPGGASMAAHRHLALMISKSCNDCTDALLAAVGGPKAVNKFMKDAGIDGFRLDRTIRTLIREDGRVDPAWTVDPKDSATPRAMGQLLAGIYQGKWLSDYSRRVLMDAMLETTTGKKWMRSALPMSAQLAHKTGTLSRTASDIGIFHTADGRAIAAAIYVTGQSPSMAIENGSRARKLEARASRDARISNITYALYNGFEQQPGDGRNWANADYGGN